ncbi:MAG: ferrous iron transport protein B [Brevinematia bacterium]
MKRVKVALVGNPNSGKTTLFNALTGSSQKVSNWPGVTVEKKVGYFKYKGVEFEVVDLPGIYSLSSKSVDERIARDFILSEKPDIVINIIDGNVFERSLYLTSMLIDSHSRLVIAINMYDELQDKGYNIDVEKASELLGVPVVPIIAKKKWNIDKLLDALVKELEDNPDKRIHIYYGNELEDVISEVENEIVVLFPDLRGTYFLRWIAITLLSEDHTILNFFPDGTSKDKLMSFVNKKIDFLKKIYREDLYEIFYDMRIGFIRGLVSKTFTKEERKFSKLDYTEILDSILMNRYLGIPILFLIMFLIFHATFSLGGALIEYMDIGINWFNDFVSSVLPNGVFKDLLVQGIIPGVGGVLAFLPQVVILFSLISFIEDTGYISRVAFLVDKFLSYFGLPGKSFLPLFIGIGCNVPGIMVSRIIEDENDRKISIFINPFMSCSARFVVYIFFASIFFPKYGDLVIFFTYILGIVVALLTAKFLRTFFFKHKSSMFVMELPPYRLPTLRGILITVWHRSWSFLKKMGTVVFVASIILWVLSYYPKPTEYPENIVKLERQIEVERDSSKLESLTKELDLLKRSYELEYSYIGRIGKFISPAVEFIGFSWREGIALISGLAAREIIISTLYITYGVDSGDEDLLRQKLINSGMDSFKALAFMVFVLFYLSCIATLIVMYKETNSLKLVLISFFYTLSLAYVFAFLIVNIPKVF